MNKIQELKKKKKKGFTLVELIVVIAIIVVLMAILIPLLSKYINDANDAKGNANARAVYSAAAAWAAHEMAVNGKVTETPGKTQIEEYFGNLDDAEISVTMNPDGSVNSVTYKQGGKSFTYPKGAAPTSSPTS